MDSVAICLAQLVLQGGRKGVGRGKQGDNWPMVRRWLEDDSKKEEESNKDK